MLEAAVAGSYGPVAVAADGDALRLAAPAMAIAFDGDLLYLGPFALPRAS